MVDATQVDGEAMELDQKQIRLVLGWRERAADPAGDEYVRFMSGWVAFNAVCAGLFARMANGRRPHIEDDSGLNGLVGSVEVVGTVEERGGGRARIQIDKPGRIRIAIREGYSESLVFREFGRAFSRAFAGWLTVPSFETTRDAFLASLRQREQAYFVINMLKAEKYQGDATLKDLIGGNVIVAVKDPSNLGQLVNVLYQVRCNVFHGEKVPGEPNDDRIVRFARPFLLAILDGALAELGIGSGASVGEGARG